MLDKKALFLAAVLLVVLGFRTHPKTQAACISPTVHDFRIPADAIPAADAAGREGREVSMGYRFVACNGAIVTLTHPRWATQAGGFVPLPGNRWLVVDVQVENPAGNRTVFYSPLWFSLVLDRALEIPPAPVVGEVLTPMYLTGGVMISGTLVFSVPKAWAQGRTFILRTRVGRIGQ